MKSFLRRDTPAAPPEAAAPFRQAEEPPRGWNLWELEQVAVGSGDLDPARDEERALLLLTLRQFAASSGELPAEFDPLVREVFGNALFASSVPRSG